MAGREHPRAATGVVRVCVEVPDDVYETMEFASILLPTGGLNEYLVGVVKDSLRTLNSIYILYILTYSRPVNIAEELLGKAGLLGRYDPRKVAATLGELITPIRRGLGDIPFRLEFDKLSVEDWDRIKKVITYIEGKEYDPREYLVERLKRIKDIARVFAIRIIEERGVIKGVRFEKRMIMYNFTGFIPKALDC